LAHKTSRIYCVIPKDDFTETTAKKLIDEWCAYQSREVKIIIVGRVLSETADGVLMGKS
jgi:hypothetical protein